MWRPDFARLRATALTTEEEPSVYFYRLRTGDHVQTGLAACFSIDEYEGNVIKRHERTRRDKEDDRTRHMIALGAQTGPVFLTYRASADVNDVAARATAGAPLVDFEAVDGVRHTLWRAGGAIATSSSPPSAESERSTSQMAIIGPPVRRGSGPKCGTGSSRAHHSVTAPAPIRCWPWRFPTIR